MYQEPFTAAAIASLRELFDPLSTAARLHAELRELGWKSAVAVRALDQLAGAIIITDGNGRVVEMNRAGEQILRRDDGLTVRQGKLCAQRVFDHDKLARFIARDLAELFGLSRAESRLAMALLAGKALRDIAADSSIQITTARTQLSSILRKVGVTRQAELIRVLSSIPVISTLPPEGK